MALVTTRSLTHLGTIEEAREVLEKSRAANAKWEGFEEEPPYSLLLIDELLGERDAIRDKLASYESSLLNYQSLLSNTVAETKAAEDAVTGMIHLVRDAAEDELPAARWRLEAARGKSRLLALRASLLQSGGERFKTLIAAAKIDLELIDRQVKTANTKPRFDDSDLARLDKISAERKKALQKEIDAVAKRLKTALSARAREQAEQEEPTGTSASRDLAEYRAQVAADRVESLQSVIESLESLIQLENFNRKAYQTRRKLIEAATPTERSEVLDDLVEIADRIRAWETVVGNEITSCGAELTKIESRAASLATDDPRFPLVNEQRLALGEELSMLRRASQAVALERRLIDRWVAEYSPKPGDGGLWDRITHGISNVWEVTRKIWAFEVLPSRTRSRWMARHHRQDSRHAWHADARAVVFRHRLLDRRAAGEPHPADGSSEAATSPDAQARTLRNWAMIVIGSAWFWARWRFSRSRSPSSPSSAARSPSVSASASRRSSRISSAASSCCRSARSASATSSMWTVSSAPSWRSTPARRSSAARTMWKR
jgi:potassium-dependent mechanosensitive channel